MNKHALLIIATILILAMLGAGAYFYFFVKKPTTTPETPAFPGGSGPITGVVTGGTTDGAGGEDTETTDTPKKPPRLFELHKTPVAGATFVEVKDKKGVLTSITARYIERGLGHIYETPLATYTETRTANETRSRIAEALWGNGGKSLVVRFLEEEGGSTIKSRALNLSMLSSSGFLQAEEVFLPDYIPFMAVAQDGSDKLFYLESNGVTTTGTTASFKNTGKTNVFNSSFNEWLPEFPHKNLITLTTRPSGSVPGHVFFLNPTTKSLTKVLGGINGLTTKTSRDGKTMLYSESADKKVNILAYDVEKKETRQLSLQTLPEKCVWSSKKTTVAYCAVPQALYPAIYPDQWYQGLISFTDNIWRIDTKTAIAENIFTGTFDIVNTVLSSDDSYLLFMNKTTGTPWVYRLTEEAPVLTTPTPTTTSPATTSTNTNVIAPSSTIEGMVRVK